ncbi:DUF1266 domain-containing protein [Salinicola socius]|uniref:DUF1266 domain-containing protein n=1 Tax=Salinicola socius TaxID=404433 RepID=A0A1Q8SSF0_9GAMM|nr:DUF1266 domain-containing protein [Salinicola socius]OLO04353.1 hypothetical protein BTW07_09350 [Salinicola socius]
MSELLVPWWAQQLTLCGWPLVSDPRFALSADQAFERLLSLGVGGRDEFAWRLWEEAASADGLPLSRLAGLELLALGSVVGWVPERTDEAWLLALASDIVKSFSTLKAWLQALAPLNDPALDAAGQELLVRERQQRGVSWLKLRHRLGSIEAVVPLWPTDLWRARAAMAPVLAWPIESSSDERRQHQALLREQGEVNGRDELKSLLFWLAGQGHRYGWEMDAVRVARQGPETRAEWLSGLNDQQDYGRVLLRFLDDQEPSDWAAWDWLRLVDQAYLGYCAGWLSASEAESFAAHAIDLLQQRYADWEAIAQAYQRGRSLFEGRDLRDSFERDWADLLGAAVTPWKMPLSRILGDEQRQAARELVRQHREGAGSWVLTVASIRDPDLIHRRHLDEPLGQARIQDAERYLEDVLGLRREEGAAGLARFWMPAQAHHLNQLAADSRHIAGRKLPRGSSQRLAACADHAATISMAEKYAFYLVMASDSGRYPATEIEALAQSLCDVLSRFYSDPLRMLSAWHAWEIVLSQDETPDEVSLADDIAWHRRDPGSPFHWLTPSRSLTWLEPGVRPTLRRFTAISLAGPLNEALWQAPQPLAPQDQEALGEWIEHQYALQGARGLVDFLDFLVEAGDRQDYQVNYAPYTLNRTRLKAEIAILESGECAEEDRVHLLRLKHVRDNACHCNDQDMTAWDIAQLVDLALAGRQLDWLDEARLSRYLDTALQLAERHYSSWQDYAEGLYSGFGFFMDDTPEREAFLLRFREALTAWLEASPLLAGAWASLDFPGCAMTHWTSFHVDILPGESRQLH